MTDAGRGRIGRAVSEFAVIVVGVLVALACNEWWSGRKESAREQAILADLAIEFAANRDQLAADIEDNEELLEATARLLELGTPGTTNLSTDSVRALAARAIAMRVFDPLNAVLRSVIAAGEFGTVSNPTLRAALASWDDGGLELQREQETALEWITQQIAPRIFAGPQSDIDITALRSSLGLLVQHQANSRSALNESRRHLARADSVLAYLERERR